MRQRIRGVAGDGGQLSRVGRGNRQQHGKRKYGHGGGQHGERDKQFRCRHRQGRGRQQLDGGAATASRSSTGTGGAVGGTNLFMTVLGKSAGEVDDKATTAVSRFFGIGTGEPTTPTAASGYRDCYELPQDPTMGFIWAADWNDIRSEGMSYGRMIAVQVDLHDQFDKLWKFAKTYMQYPGTDTMAWKYYFRWARDG